MPEPNGKSNCFGGNVNGCYISYTGSNEATNVFWLYREVVFMENGCICQGLEVVVKI
ncbi:hypothetical protein HPP92_029067 [Vanilla planifolia]|uniref:Uncharacterized protein n=1 Tax=Vanilla planifolia TaxID=51239 RepID=A0A835P6U6_VANPL|nr:hypothetical protein HPP92_029056 [Vanilla planifolia]KAG0445984.1 hypothetical protein HPP92_029067 [Vanilla planifolia]